MPKIIPVPHYWFALLYFLPLMVYAGVIVYKLPRVPKEKRGQWLGLLGLVFSVAAITASLLKFPS